MEKGTESRVTSVFVTRCGNFGVLGFANGLITKMNMQSGKERGVFSLDAKNPVGESTHTNEVTGLGVDSMNRWLVSCSRDRSVKIWDFYRCKLLKSYTTDFPVTNLAYNLSNDLVAISCSDLAMTILNP